MKNKILVLGLVVAFSASLQAQTLQEGTWTGSAVSSDGSSNDVTFEVKTDGGQLSITYNSPVGAISLETIRLEGDTLSYTFTGGGSNVSCSLKRQKDGCYTGECESASGGRGRHTMNPPEG